MQLLYHVSMMNWHSLHKSAFSIYNGVNFCFIQEDPLGVWEFRSKSRQNSCSLEGGCRGYMFALEVTEELGSWAEKTSYNRKWVSKKLKSHSIKNDITRKFKIGIENHTYCTYIWRRLPYLL